MGGQEEDVNSIEITNYDLERMRGAPPNDRYAKFLRKKEELRKLSKERYNKWPNTITAMREKRLADRRRELERIEEELCKQDALNAQNRAEKRRQQISKANKMIQIAHLGKARTKLLMSSVLEEREAQIKYRNKMDGLWDKQEDKWVDFQRRQREGWKEEEDEEEKKRLEAVRTMKKGRLEQLEDRKRYFQNLKDEKERQKLLLRKQVQEDEEAAKVKDEAKRQKVLEARSDFIASNKEQTKRKEAEKLRLKEMDKKIAEYAAYRDRVEEERKVERERKEAEKQAKREIMLAKLEKQLLEARQDNETRLKNQEAEHKAAEDQREQERAEKALADWEQCDRSRKQQIRIKKDRVERDRSDEMDEALGVRERLRMIEREEKAEARKARELRTEVAKQNLRMAAERQEREVRFKENDKKEYQEAHDFMEQNDIPEDYIIEEYEED